METMTETQAESMKRLKKLVFAVNGDIWRYAGPSNSGLRQAMMQMVTGSRLPKAQCGVTALEKALCGFAGVTGDCLAHRERNLCAWAAR